MTGIAFDRSEYLVRLENTRRKMGESGVDVLVITDPSNVVYLSGYSSESAYTPQALLVRLDVDEPTLIMRAMDSHSACQTAFVDQSRIFGYPESLIGVKDKNGYDFIIDHLLANGFANKRIGVEIGSGHFSAATWMKFQARLPDAKFADMTGVVTWIRLVKSPAEIAYMKQAAELSDLAMKAVVDAAGEGVRQRDAGAALISALVRGNGEFGSDRALHPNMPAGALINAPHLAWTDGVYKAGDVINVELGGSRKRYASGLSRSISIGKPSRAMVELHETVREGMDTALEQAKPGNTCGVLWDAYNSVISKKGYTKTSRIGYSIGIDWLEPTASLQHGDETQIVPNMMLHMICGMWEEGNIGYVLSDVLLFNERGYELLGKTPRQMFVKD